MRVDDNYCHIANSTAVDGRGNFLTGTALPRGLSTSISLTARRFAKRDEVIIVNNYRAAIIFPLLGRLG